MCVEVRDVVCEFSLPPIMCVWKLGMSLCASTHFNLVLLILIVEAREEKRRKLSENAFS